MKLNIEEWAASVCCLLGDTFWEILFFIQLYNIQYDSTHFGQFLKTVWDNLIMLQTLDQTNKI